MNQNVSSHFADSEQVKNLVVILLTLDGPKKFVVILLLIVGHSSFLNVVAFLTLLNPSYSCLSVKIFSCLYFLVYMFSAHISGVEILNFSSQTMVTLAFLKKFLVTDQLELGKIKIHSQFLILHLLCWCNKKL